LALSVGKYFEEKLGLPAQSIRLYNEAVGLLKEPNDTGLGVGGKATYRSRFRIQAVDLTDCFRHITGFSSKVLNEVGADELSYMVRLQVALGHALAMGLQTTSSVTAYQNALRVSSFVCAKECCVNSTFS
jgi:hypothetical protein